MPLPKWELLNGDAATCPSCGRRNTVRVFPAALAQDCGGARRDGAGWRGSLLRPSRQAGRRGLPAVRTFRVPALRGGVRRRASGAPPAWPLPAAKPKPANSDTSRTLYDTWALATPFALLVIWPLTILSAPAVVALAIMKWKQPISLVRRNRGGVSWLGLAVALAQGGAWCWLIWYLVAKARSRA